VEESSESNLERSEDLTEEEESPSEEEDTTEEDLSELDSTRREDLTEEEDFPSEEEDTAEELQSRDAENPEKQENAEEESESNWEENISRSEDLERTEDPEENTESSQRKQWRDITQENWETTAEELQSENAVLGHPRNLAEEESESKSRKEKENSPRSWNLNAVEDTTVSSRQSRNVLLKLVLDPVHAKRNMYKDIRSSTAATRLPKRFQ